MSLVPYRSSTGPRRTVVKINKSYNQLSTNFKRKNTTNGPYRSLTSGQHHVNPIYPPSELKFYDSSHNGDAFLGTNTPTQIYTTGQVVTLNNLVNGVNPVSRIGYSVNIKSCAYRYEVVLPSTGGQTSGRVILLWDKQPNGTTPIYTSIFSKNSYLAYMDPFNTDRFTVLRNERFSLSPNGDMAVFVEGFVKINMRSTYNPPISSLVPWSGALWLVYIGEEAQAATNPLIQGCWRIRYSDK